MITDPSVLIITFYYPPYPKVGSRRWVKFAKYLNRHKKNIHVLAAQMDVDEKSPWDDDAKEIEHLTTRIHFKYDLPYFKRELPGSFASKIKWQISKYIHGANKKLPGNPHDESEKYAPDFIKAAKKIIAEQKINTIIFTASPNHLAYHISKLKSEFKDVKFIFDLRDYWSDWMKHLNKDQFDHELYLEEQTISNSDIILSPAKKIIDTLRVRYPKKATQMHILPHAYDSDDFENNINHEDLNKRKEPINLVYAGSLYENMEDNMKLLAGLLNTNKHIQLTFYTFTNDYKEFFTSESIKDRVIYLKPLPIKVFTKKMEQEASAFLYMRSTLNDDNNFLSSKFFDFLPLKKPIIYLGNKGDALDFIEKENIGFHLNNATSMDFELSLSDTAQKIKNFDIQKYSFESVTRLLETEIEN